MLRDLFTCRRLPAVVLLGAALASTLAAQGAIEYGAVYVCPGENRFKVYSCSGNDANSSCDTQALSGQQPGQRGPAPRGQVMALVRVCHIQTAAEARPGAPDGRGQLPANEPGAIKPGDPVEVVTAQGWTPAKVLAVQGNNYRVSVNGVLVTKTYPTEVRRIGPATAQDHAAGQYRLGDRVLVNVNGQWLEGKVVTEFGMEYQVQFGNRTVWAGPQNLRPSTAVPPSAPKAGIPPRPGMVSCAGKFEGRYSGSGLGSVTITFRSGKATMFDMLGGEQALECWTAGDKIILREAGKPENDMPLDVNDDGTLQTPLWGEIKKKGK